MELLSLFVDDCELKEKLYSNLKEVSCLLSSGENDLLLSILEENDVILEKIRSNDMTKRLDECLDEELKSRIDFLNNSILKMLSSHVKNMESMNQTKFVKTKNISKRVQVSQYYNEMKR